ncbi:hypothetical protein [Pontiella sp.]|uniref:hypothetical protein n=1 Tax=Pontiella sp. TaxID=2837462 RepID=UPI003566798A
MKSDKIKFLLCLLFLVVLAAVTFRCVWPADHVFQASDLNIGRLAFKKNYMPESLTGFFTANQVMGSGGSQFILFTVLMSLMPLETFANTFYGLMLVLGSISTVWFLRLWGRSWMASVFGALIAFWVNSIMLAPSGHAYKLEVLVFSVLSLCLVEKAVRSRSVRHSSGFSMLAGLSIGIMMIEQQDVALLAGLFIGPYAIFRLIQRHGRHAFRWVSMLVPIAVVSILLSGSTLLGSYKHNIVGAASLQKGKGAGGGDQKWNYITQWSMVPGEWPDLIAPGWAGWSTGNPEGPYWGKIGQSAEWESTKQGFQNFKLDSIYLGITPFLLAAFGVWAAIRIRKDEEGKVILFWSIAGLVGFILAFGKYSLLYKLFFQLPLVSNIRAPIKLLDNFQICLAIVAAFGLDRLLVDGKAAKSAKVLWIACSACFGLMLLAGLKLLAFPNSLRAEFTAMGYERYVDVILTNMANAWFHAAALVLICGALVFLVWKGLAKAKWVVVTFIAVLAVDSLMLTSHYFKADDISTIKKGNVLVNYLKDHQGDERAFFVDQSGIYNQWLASDGPYHKLKLFNIWQMPRMPVEYKEYLGTVGRNQIRLWQLSAVKHVAAPAQIMQQLEQNPELAKQFKPVLNYKVPTAQGMRPDVLLEFLGGIPRFALFQNWETVPLGEHCDKLVDPIHNPQNTVLVDSACGLESKLGTVAFQPVAARTTKRKATIEIDAPSLSILRFSQRYQGNWNVFVDGEPADLLRLDYLSMGVQVPAGKHTVEFHCPSATSKRFFVGMVFLISVVGAVWLLVKRNDESTGE